MSKVKLHLYRYQILPRDRFFQGDLYGASSIDDLIRQKNEIFKQALLSDGAFQSARTDVAVRPIHQEGNFLLFRLAANRSITLEAKDFSTKSTENWPKILFAILNEPNQQIIAIQHRSSAFQSTDAVMRMAMKSIESFLYNYQLVVEWEPLFEKKAFWDLVKTYEGRVKKVEFEFITPNMAGISKVLPEGLKSLAKKSNATKGVLAIEAAHDASLTLNKDDPVVGGLASYAGDGGGSIALTIRGLRNRVKTKGASREVEIDEINIEGNAKIVVQAILDILK